MAALHSTGQALQADVVGAAVAAEGHELDLLVSGDLACALETVVGSLDAGQSGAGVGEGVVDERSIPARVRVHGRGDLEATGRVGDDDVVVAGTEHDLAHGDACTAATAEAMTAAEALGQVREFLDARHDYSPSFLAPR